MFPCSAFYTSRRELGETREAHHDQRRTSFFSLSCFTGTSSFKVSRSDCCAHCQKHNRCFDWLGTDLGRSLPRLESSPNASKGLERGTGGAGEDRHRTSVWKNRPAEGNVFYILMDGSPSDPFGSTSPWVRIGRGSPQCSSAWNMMELTAKNHVYDNRRYRHSGYQSDRSMSTSPSNKSL